VKVCLQGRLARLHGPALERPTQVEGTYRQPAHRVFPGHRMLKLVGVWQHHPLLGIVLAVQTEQEGKVEEGKGVGGPLAPPDHSSLGSDVTLFPGF